MSSIAKKASKVKKKIAKKRGKKLVIEITKKELELIKKFREKLKKKSFTQKITKKLVKKVIKNKKGLAGELAVKKLTKKLKKDEKRPVRKVKSRTNKRPIKKTFDRSSKKGIRESDRRKSKRPIKKIVRKIRERRVTKKPVKKTLKKLTRRQQLEFNKRSRAAKKGWVTRRKHLVVKEKKQKLIDKTFDKFDELEGLDPVVRKTILLKEEQKKDALTKFLTRAAEQGKTPKEVSEILQKVLDSERQERKELLLMIFGMTEDKYKEGMTRLRIGNAMGKFYDTVKELAIEYGVKANTLYTMFLYPDRILI
jgi:hypothetical protein